MIDSDLYKKAALDSLHSAARFNAQPTVLTAQVLLLLNVRQVSLRVITFRKIVRNPLMAVNAGIAFIDGHVMPIRTSTLLPVKIH